MIPLCARFRASVVFGTLLSALTVTGCGESISRPATVPVSGTVMYKGQPLEGATVAFMGEGAPRAASGVSDAKGEFKLSMFRANDGAMVGPNTVLVTKPNPAAAGPASTSPANIPPDPAKLAEIMQTTNVKKKVAKSLIPEKYGSPASSPLKETVTEKGPNTFVLQLTD